MRGFGSGVVTYQGTSQTLTIFEQTSGQTDLFWRVIHQTRAQKVTQPTYNQSLNQSTKSEATLIQNSNRHKLPNQRTKHLEATIHHPRHECYALHPPEAPTTPFQQAQLTYPLQGAPKHEVRLGVRLLPLPLPLLPATPRRSDILSLRQDVRPTMGCTT